MDYVAGPPQQNQLCCVDTAAAALSADSKRYKKMKTAVYSGVGKEEDLNSE